MLDEDPLELDGDVIALGLDREPEASL